MQTDNPQTSILTLNDAISDSPIYRSTAIHFDDQVDLFEKWLDLLSKNMKQYVDKLNKFNLETNILCKKVIPVGIDDSIIDPNFTGGVIKSFSDALQTSLAFKTKLVSDLEENFIQPLQLFIKTHLKEFKDFRKQHEKVLEKYEAQLAKYTSQSKSKEPSAIREEAFRLFEVRKAYTHMSGQHVIRILHFRSLVEHFLVERFSLATASHLKEIESNSKAWIKLQSSLISWKQWLLDDKETCDYQFNQLQNARISIENKYLTTWRPVRDLEKYNISLTQVNLNNRHSLDFSTAILGNKSQASYKWGYLFVRGARNNWFRRWFFLYDGCFGSCHVNPNLKYKGTITLNDRVSLLLCDIKPINDIDRRNCFEVMCAHQPSFVLQAETEVEMHEWISAFEKAKRLMLQSEGFKATPSHTTEDSISNSIDKTLNILTKNCKPDETSTVSSLLEPYIIQDSNPSTTENKSQHQKNKPSIVMLSNMPNTDQHSTTSLTPLLVWEASRVQSSANSTLTIPTSPAVASFSNITSPSDPSTQDDNQLTVPPASQPISSSWGIPWTLVPSLFQGATTDDMTNTELTPTSRSSNMPAVTDAEGHQIVWPTRIDDSNVPKVDLTSYPPALDTKNKELRQLFGGVESHEVVLFSFVGLLKKKPSSVDTVSESEVPPSPTIANHAAEPFEQELSSQLPTTVKEPTSNFGYAYTGRGYVTQDTFWFYSCVLMHCVNTMAIRLSDITHVRLIRDPSIPNNGTNSSLVLAIDVAGNLDPLIITTLMEDVEVLAEKLKFAVANAKLNPPEPLQVTYDVVSSLSATSNKNKAQVKTIIKSEPVRSASEGTLAPEPTSPLPTKSSDIKKKLNSKPRKYSAPVQPKSGALAAAMMAASVAGGTGFLEARKGLEENRSGLFSKKSKTSLTQNQEEHDVSTGSSTPVLPETPILVQEVKTLDDPHAPPSDFKAPSGPVSCDCDNHFDKLEAEVELPVSAKHLFYIMFCETNPDTMDIWNKKTIGNKSKDLSMTPWAMVDGKNERTLKYIIPVNNAMVKLKEAEVVEKQVIEKKEDYLRYVVLTSTKTAQLPYADAFVPYVKYCITWVSPDSCKLCCYTGVKFLKNILVKGMVNKAAMKGMSENITVFVPILKDETSHKESPKSKSGHASSLKRGGTIKYASSPKASSEDQQNQKELSPLGSEWYSQLEPYTTMAKDLVSNLPFAVKAGAAAFLFLWFLISSFRSGSQNDIHTNTPGYHQDQFQPVVSRAVYLRDINEGLIHQDVQPLYSHSDSFRSFMETKLPNRTLNTNHRWLSTHHHQFAIELLFSREKLAMLRHDTLVLFQLVNEIDSQLFENEYTNWLMDVRLQCRLPEVDYEALHCDDVKRQLKSFPIGSYQKSLK